MKAYTTIEESKKLIESGLDANTADMFYSRRPTGKSDYSKFPDFKPEGRLEVFTKVDLPCWSLAALLNILPHEIEYDEEELPLLLNIYPYDGKFYIGYEQREDDYVKESTNVVTIIIWLLKNNYIKKAKEGLNIG